MSKRAAPSDAEPPNQRRRTIADPHAPLLLPWNATDNTDNLTRILQAPSWQALFQIDPENGEQDPEAREVAVRHRRRLLLLAAHPDKGPPEECQLRHAATTKINALFAEAAKTWAPAESAAGPPAAGPAAPSDEPPPALCGPSPATAGPAHQLVGKRVKLHGLSDPALNGRYGDVTGVSASGERAEVQVDDDPPDTLKSVRPGNLLPVPRGFVRGGALELLARMAAAVDDHGTAKTPELIYSAPLAVYTGFGMAKMLKRNAQFEAMAANRCVSAEVIAARTAANCRRRLAGGPYHDFGLISLVVVRYGPGGGREAQYKDVWSPAAGRAERQPLFYVLDGQHRLMTMNALMEPETWAGALPEARARLALDAERIPFQISVKVVDSKAAANRALLEMQDCYAPDRRCFFLHDHEASVAGAALELAKLAWPRAFVPLDLRVKANRLVPDRPMLDDGCFFDFLRDSALLRVAVRNDVPVADKARYLFDHLRIVNDAVRTGGAPGSLSTEAFRNLGRNGKTSGCYLGYYRHDANGSDLMGRLRLASDARSTLPARADGKRPVVPADAMCPFVPR